MNWVKEYWSKIESGEIPVCTETRNIYKRMVEEMDDEFIPFYFSEGKGEHAIRFIETFCRHYEGEKAGQVVELELWQKAFVQNIFGWIEKATGYRRFREYALEVTRKHGKSFLSGCIATYMLVADGEPGAQCYSAANKLDQRHEGHYRAVPGAGCAGPLDEGRPDLQHDAQHHETAA